MRKGDKPKIVLQVPVLDIYVTQPFGVNYLSFYRKLGMNGHNGIDFKTQRGCPVRASHSGIVVYEGEDSGGGISVTLLDEKNRYKTIYYHLLETKVKKGQNVYAGKIIGLADNTGRYTTGNHLHFGLKEVDENGDTINKNNGYRGGIDPAPFFPKNWDKPPAYHRYGRKGNYWAEIKVRFKNPWLHRYLKKRNLIYKVYDNEFINALIYGGWGVDEILNPTLRNIWAYRKKYDDNKTNIFQR